MFFNLDKQFRELNQQSIDELKEVLESIGIEISIDDKHQEIEFLSVILTDEFEKKITRDAGRKSKSIKVMITVEDIEKMTKEKTADVVAKKLGISRATLFRKLKKSKRRGRWIFILNTVSILNMIDTCWSIRRCLPLTNRCY